MTELTASAPMAPRGRKAPAIRIGDVFGRSREIFGDRLAIYSCIAMIGYAAAFALDALCEWITSGDATSGLAVPARILTYFLSFSIPTLAHSVIHFSAFQIV